MVSIPLTVPFVQQSKKMHYILQQTTLLLSPLFSSLQRLMNLDEDDLASSTATFTEEKYPLIVVEWNLQEENGVSTIPCIGIPPGLNATTIQ